MRLVLTGGTGTFGRAFIRRALASGRWSAVRSLSRHEIKVARLDAEFAGSAPFKAMLGDVRDAAMLDMAFRGADAVVHAAALKRVDVGAYSPYELIETNIRGTQNVLTAAIKNHVRKVVVVSSDKSVAPINLYGATKYVAETCAVQSNAYGFPSGTLASAVRYGNVLGSTGSVARIWREQLRAGLPLSVTHADMTRFVMTIEQACALVEYALDHMRGGEVYVPALRSARMTDLARAVALVELPRSAAEAWPVHVLGALRAGGEKMAESMLNEEEPCRTVRSGPHFAVLPTHHEWTLDPWPGERVPAAFRYRSDENGEYLTPAELAAMLASTEAYASAEGA